MSLVLRLARRSVSSTRRRHTNGVNTQTFLQKRSMKRSMSTVVHSDKAPPAIGPYSQAVKANGFVFVSGCLGLDQKGELTSKTDVVEQTDVALQNMGHILEAAGSSFDRVVKTTVLMDSMDNYATINQVYAKYFTGKHPPARAAFAVRTLPKHALVEIECVAVAPDAE